MTRSRLPAAAGLALLLTGCTAVGPDYRPPETAAPARWADWHAGDADLAAPDAASAPARSAAFGDATLAALQARAAAANLDLRVASLRLAEARSVGAQARSQQGPQVAARAGATRERLSESGSATRLLGALGAPAQQAQLVKFLATPFTLYQAGFDASWEIDLWGRVRRSVESAAAQEGQAQALLAQARLVLRAEVARDYFMLRAQRTQQAALEDERAALREATEVLAAQVRDGLVQDDGRLAAAQQTADLDARIDALRAADAAALAALAALCGEPPGALDTMLAAARPGGPAQPDPPLPDLGRPGDFLRAQPDVAAAERRLAAATADIGVAVADLYPRVALGASAGFESVHGSEFGDWGSRTWSVGPSLALPVFDQGRRRATIELKRLQQQEAAVAFQQTVLQAWHDVDGAVTGYQSARREREAAARHREAAEQAFALAQARHAGGLVDALPGMQARAALAEARRAEAEAAGRQAVAAVAVLKALGDDGAAGPRD